MKAKIKQYLRDPNTYYIVVPVVAVIWAVYAWQVALPHSSRKVDDYMKQYTEAEGQIGQILDIDSERLQFKKPKDASASFDFTTVIDQLSRQCGIAPSKYSLVVGREIKRSGKKTRTADITLNEINVETFSRFISDMLMRWPDIECELLKLAKLNAGPDTWKVNMKFTYYSN